MTAPTVSYTFHRLYNWKAFYTIQPTLATRRDQFEQWSDHILSYSRYNHLYRLTLVDALKTPLFQNDRLGLGLTLNEAKQILDWMSGEEGGARIEWIGGEGGNKSSYWVYWRRPEEWAEVLAGWVEETGQKNTVLTLYELTEGEGSISQEFHGMDLDILQKALQVLVKRSKAQVFGSEDQQGVKFF